MEIEKLKQILFNVNHLCSHISCSRTQIKKIDFGEHKQIYTDIERLLTIYVCSLLDELVVFEKFVHKQDNFYLSDTLYVIVPLIDYLKQFDSLKVKRNKLLAHLNRDQSKTFNPWWKALDGKRFSTTIQEDRMLFSTIKCIHDIFKKRFAKELKEVLEEFNKEIDIYEKKIMEMPSVDTYKDIAPTIEEVQNRMKERDFTFTILSRM